MSIKPLDMQVMLPKVTEVAKMKQIENNKNNLNQHNITQNTIKQKEKKLTTVKDSNKNEKRNSKFDAKEKGNNLYQRRNNKKKKSQNKLNINDNKNNKYTRIDIKI